MQDKKHQRRRRHAREARKRAARQREARQHEARQQLGLVRGLLFRAVDRVRTWFDAAASRLGHGDERKGGERKGGERKGDEARARGQSSRQERRRRGPNPIYHHPFGSSYTPPTWPWSAITRHSPYLAGPEYYYQQMLPPGVRSRPLSRPGRHTGRGPRGYTRPDARIIEDINEALTYSPHIDATDIEVRVDQGDVTVSGTVDDRYIKRLVENIIEDVSGVRDVHNQLRVERRGGQHTAGGMASGREDARDVRRATTLGQDFEAIEASQLNAGKEGARKDQTGGFSGT
jgi:hypothetical protein